jgi:hypothetical protein
MAITAVLSPAKATFEILVKSGSGTHPRRRPGELG